MDRTPGDNSRPAAIAGWTRIDFGIPGAGVPEAWLNGAPLDAGHFRDYRQTLDLRAATLTTRCHCLNRGRDTGIQVQTFVSMAAPHLAVTRFTFIPDYDGPVDVSLVLASPPQHEPRFAPARLTGPQVTQALAAQATSWSRAMPPGR